MYAAHLSPSPAGWLLQFQRGHSPLWELACQRWSLTIPRVNWMNAALLSPSPAGWLLQVPGIFRDRPEPSVPESIPADWQNAAPAPHRPSVESGGTASTAGSTRQWCYRQTIPAPSAHQSPGFSSNRRKEW